MHSILVVDDEQIMRAFLKKALTKLGYTVTLATNVDEGLECFAPRRFSLVLSDLRMPGRSGLDLLDAVRSVDPTTPLVIMTAYGSIDSAVDAIRRGAADFVPKPLELAQLELVLERTIANRKTSEELDRLRPHADDREGLGELIGRSYAMKQVYALVDKVAPEDLTVLILGETGTGKELCARAIHDHSQRSKERFQVVNCAGLQETLLESELFGHEKGAFTGADRLKRGHFEVASGGTLFLDEVGEAPPSVQAKLLRAIQEKEIQRVGGTDSIKTDVRILAATNRDLEAEVKSGRFREDLYWRLSAFPILLAPLRERLDDVSTLVDHFLRKVGRGPDEGALTLDASLLLTRYEWPGNVRQLENVIARASVLAGEAAIDVSHLPPEVLASVGASPPDSALDGGLLELPLRQARQRFERAYIQNLLRRCKGNVSEAARQADMGRASMHDKINKLGIDPDRFRQAR
jgi:two-component system response regulator HydG